MARRDEKNNRGERIAKGIRLAVESSFVKKLVKVLAVLYGILMLIAIALIVLALLAFVLSLLDWSKLNLQFYETLLEYLKVLVWPIVVVIGTIAFSAELKKMMRRINKVKYKGATAILEPSRDLQAPPDEDGQFLQSELNDDTVQQLGESEEDYLDRMYRRPEIQLAFERTYRVIFGTQLELLQKAASVPSLGLTSEAAQSFYEEYIRLGGYIEYEFKEYINFLIGQGLLEYFSVSDTFKLTTAGRLFLRYLLDQGINDSKMKNY